MCQSCSPQKLTRTYSKGMVVQILGKPPRPCASPKGSSTTPTGTETLPCSPRVGCPSSTAAVGKAVVSEKQDQAVTMEHNSPRSKEASAVKGPSWKMFAGDW